MRTDRGQRTWLALVAVALAAMSLYAAAFFPGVIGFDSAYQWWQARGGETSSVHGLGMIWLWHLGDALTQSPAALFTLQLAACWCGLVLIAAALPVQPIRQVAFLLVAGLGPMPFVVLSSVVSDAMLMALLCCALGICVGALGRDRRTPFVFVLFLLFLAVLVRKNALPAVLPLAAFACWREFPRMKPMYSLLAGSCIAVAMQGASLLFERSVDRPVTVSAATQVWDLAAISIATGEMLLPPTIHGAGLDVADLRQAFEPYTNVTIFTRTRAGLTPPFFAPGDLRNDEIRHAWINAIMQHPWEYLAHRWHVTTALFGSKPAEWPREMVYFPANTPYRDNPVVPANTGRLHALLIGWIDASRCSMALAAWPYVVLAFAAGVVAWRRRASEHAQAALAAIASGLLYAAPLSIIAPSVELRYLAWTCVASILGAALAFAARVDNAALLSDTRANCHCRKHSSIPSPHA